MSRQSLEGSGFPAGVWEPEDFGIPPLPHPPSPSLGRTSGGEGAKGNEAIGARGAPYRVRQAVRLGGGGDGWGFVGVSGGPSCRFATRAILVGLAGLPSC